MHNISFLLGYCIMTTLAWTRQCHNLLIIFLSFMRCSKERESVADSLPYEHTVYRVALCQDQKMATVTAMNFQTYLPSSCCVSLQHAQSVAEMLKSTACNIWGTAIGQFVWRTNWTFNFRTNWIFNLQLTVSCLCFKISSGCLTWLIFEYTGGH